jgi:hypothetical protein
MRCQSWFDDENPSFEQQRELERKPLNTPLAGLVVVAGPPGIEVGYATVLPKGPTPMRRGSEGFYIACKHCNKEFESDGLRCYSKDRLPGERGKPDQDEASRDGADDQAHLRISRLRPAYPKVEKRAAGLGQSPVLFGPMPQAGREAVRKGGLVIFGPSRRPTILLAFFTSNRP